MPNRATLEAKAFCLRLVSDREYQKNLRIRWRAGDLPPQVETMIWHYAYGQPKNRIELTGPNDAPVVFTCVLDTPSEDG